MEFNCLKATEPQQGDKLLLTTKSKESPGTHLIDSRGTERRVNFGATSDFENGTPGLGIQHLK